MTCKNPTEQEMIERGKAVFEDCYRGVVKMPPSVEAGAFSGLTMKMFNDYWGGIDELTMREKRLVILGVIAGLGNPAMFAIHSECALRNGELGPDELRGAIKMALPYVGFPNASGCYVEVEKAIAKTAATAS